MMKNPGFRQEEEKGSGEDRKGRRKLCRGGEDKVFSFWRGIIAVPPRGAAERALRTETPISKESVGPSDEGGAVFVIASDGQFLMVSSDGSFRKRQRTWIRKRRSRPNERALARLRPPEEIVRDPE